MADFKTTLERLARQEIEFDDVAKNIHRLLEKKPHAAVTVMEQLKLAVTESVIEAETYARLKSVVAEHLETPSGVGDDGERTVFASDDGDESNDVFDLTGGSNPDATMILGAGDDATQILDPTTAGTPMSGDNDIDFDLSGDTGSSSWPTDSSQTGQTGTDWAQPEPSGATTKLGPGAVLRGRFQLDEVLGVGGMGSVYLGSDLIKVRAKDKQPRVALKVLNEDFKQHPDSFIALQREASRQQKLAHPNIATVYDFDQTEDGLAFLVMEVLEGEALNDFIKKVVKPKGGLTFEEALPMVQGLGNALVYAHDHNIVHSDFKPGNCFVTNEGQMKVLDFGIARAVKAPGAAEGETTIFDPGKLGALTPAYASVEMLEGEEPDTRDDIYALACVAYELLTGKHPFNKIPANKARDSGLVPEPIKTISRKQWRGLERGLAYKREDRSQNTAEFLEEFEGATSPFKNPLIMVPAVAALIFLAGFFPAKNYLDEQDISARIVAAQTGDAAAIEGVLNGLADDQIETAKRDRVLTEAKEQILNHFDRQARAKIDIDEGNYDFAGARQTLDKALSYSVYADSSTLLDLRQHIDDVRNRVLNEQFERFNTALAEGNLLEVDGEDDIHDAMAVVRKVDPTHGMLKDRRIPGTFANAINDALSNEDYDYADKLGLVGIDIMPDSQNLKNLTDKIAGAKDRAETNLRIIQAIGAIQAARDSGGGLAAYSAVGDSVADLAAADPGNPLLDEVRQAIAPLAKQDIETLEATKNWGNSRLMGGNFKGLLRGLRLHDVNARAVPLGREFDQLVATARGKVTEAIAAQELSREAAEQLGRLAALAPHSPKTQNARAQLAKANLAEAQLARDAGNFDDASAALKRASGASPGSAVDRLISQERERIAADAELDDAARGEVRAQRATQFAAELPAFRQAIDDLSTEAMAYSTAFSQLETLQALQPNAPELQRSRDALAGAIERGAAQMGAAGQWDDAVDISRQALVNLPTARELGSKLAALEIERKEAIAENEKKLVAEAKQAIPLLLQDPVADRDWRTQVRRHMETLNALAEPDDTTLQQYGPQIAAIYVKRAGLMRQEQRLAEGANLLADAARLAPDVPGLAAEREALASATEAFEREQEEQARIARIDGLKQTFETQARANNVAGASNTLDALRQELGDTEDPFVQRDAPRLLARAYFKLATTRATAGDFAAALTFAQGCIDLDPNRPECKNAVSDYTVSGNRQDLDKTFERGGNFDLEQALAKVAVIQQLDADVFNDSEPKWAPLVAARIQQMQDAIGAASNPILESAKELFEGNTLIAALSPVAIKGTESEYGARISLAIENALLGEAKSLIKEAHKSEKSHPTIVALTREYNSRLNQAKGLFTTYKGQFAKYKEQENKEHLVAARETIVEALGIWQDSATFKRAIAEIDAILNDKPAPLPPPPASTSPCKADLAGHGKRKRGVCYYFVAQKARGPQMVVVPPGDGFSSPFAIGKYEVSVGDFNRYCKLSGACKGIADRDRRLPATNLSLQQAQDYVAWLAERTGQKYRLPTADEWTYASAAGGAQPKKDYNCRVEQGSTVLKGQGLMNINAGKANGWGLYNYVGNAQEWVLNGSEVVARGGAYLDAFSKCEIGLEKAHAGTADEVTGFRVLLEMGS